MNKLRPIIIFLLFLLFFAANSLEAYPCGRGLRPGAGGYCRRYMDPSIATYDGDPFGYIDNINYPDYYGLPWNRCFNHCPAAPGNYRDYLYFRRCVEHTFGTTSYPSIIQRPNYSLPTIQK